MGKKSEIRISVYIVIFLLGAASVKSGQFFVATTGSDTAAGTIDTPLKTIGKAISLAKGGDTIYVRGGTYALTSTVTFSKSGTITAKYYLFGFQDERPLLDFTGIAFGSRGLNLNRSYWHIRGIDIRKAEDNGMIISGSNNIVENCSFSENSDTGLQLAGGASNNQIINCDSYFNADPGQGNADGFAPKLDVGTGNYFYGCRAWQNSDDGWDGYMRPADNVTTTLENCWTFQNGYLKSGSASSGNGNGFKLGGMDNSLDSLRHNMILRHCLAFDNRVKGFDQNNNRGSMTLLNCTGYRNGTNYKISAGIKSGSVLTVKNSLALGNYGDLASFAIQQTNSWLSPFSVTSADFVSIDTTGVRGPRKPDGSLPDVPFMHLAEGSQLIDGGTDIGLPFVGSAPDLGAFEFVAPVVRVDERVTVSLREYVLYQNYPNPFNPSTVIRYNLPTSGFVTLKLYSILGKEVETLVNGSESSGTHAFTLSTLNFKLSTGVYLYTLRANGVTVSKKMMLVK